MADPFPSQPASALGRSAYTLGRTDVYTGAPCGVHAMRNVVRHRPEKTVPSPIDHVMVMLSTEVEFRVVLTSAVKTSQSPNWMS